MGKVVQIRDVDDEVYRVLRSRAAAEDLSLSQYLRRMLAREAGTPTMAELLERADRRRARGAGVSREEILTALHEGRDGRG